MKPALKIDMSRKAGLSIVTTEDGVIGLPLEAALDKLSLFVLISSDYTNTPYNYFPADLVGVVMELGDDWENVYTLQGAPEGVTLH